MANVMGLARRAGWNVIDQVMSALSNMLLMVFVARALDKTAFGAFAMAFVAYGVAVALSKAMVGQPLQMRHSADSPEAFRRAVAHVYLRRNQADVLVELPDVVASDDWVELGAPEERAYRAAVEAGNLMAMRQAAWHASGTTPAKLARLLEIVDEAGGAAVPGPGVNLVQLNHEPEPAVSGRSSGSPQPPRSPAPGT